jgi:MFS transporter, DHA2 family, multidrug resistance protein
MLLAQQQGGASGNDRSAIEGVSYELGSLAGVTALGTILTAVYTSTIHLPATTPARAAGSIDEARAAAGHLPAGQAHALLDAAASAFDNGYTLALAITAIALAAGSAFTYRYLKRQPATPQNRPSTRTGPARPVAAAAGRQLMAVLPLSWPHSQMTRQGRPASLWPL